MSDRLEPGPYHLDPAYKLFIHGPGIEVTKGTKHQTEWQESSDENGAAIGRELDALNFGYAEGLKARPSTGDGLKPDQQVAIAHFADLLQASMDLCGSSFVFGQIGKPFGECSEQDRMLMGFHQAQVIRITDEIKKHLFELTSHDAFKED